MHFFSRETTMRILLLTAAFLATSWTGLPSDEAAPAGTVIRLTVSAAAAPRPALRYQLLPELSEMNPGNPIQSYLKCFMEQEAFFHGKQAVADRDKWSEMPLKDLPLDKLRGYGGIALRQADYAARLDTPDWQILHQLKMEGAYLLLPEVQPMRSLVSALKVRFRSEVAARRFDDALATAKTMFAISRHLGEHPTLIGNLVGVAVAFIAIDGLEEMLQQPGCPNLYWALTILPHPLVSTAKAVQGERLLLSQEFGLDDAEPMSRAQLDNAFKRFQKLFRDMHLTEGLAGPPSPSTKPAPGRIASKGPKLFPEWFDDCIKDEAYLRKARQRLIEYGLARDKVDRFPPAQVVLLDGRRAYEELRDDALKTYTLPYWQAKRLADLRKPGEESPFTRLATSFSRPGQAQTRLAQRLALLRCVEAVRLYAAEHTGNLPGRLADTQLPLPVDPFTGDPFTYELKDATATIRGRAPFSTVVCGYEVRIRRH
jgi:hypothetical protein